ncbi:MAG: hypothetical protein QOJ27_308, partial [Sphingomonadales bacterium]|nr:hypothetical protein [Sphingomonadales bacterium]
RPRGGLNPEQKMVMDDAIAALKAQGAIVLDVDIPSVVAPDEKDNLLLSGQSIVLNYGMTKSRPSSAARARAAPASMAPARGEAPFSRSATSRVPRTRAAI